MHEDDIEEATAKMPIEVVGQVVAAVVALVAWTPEVRKDVAIALGGVCILHQLQGRC